MKPQTLMIKVQCIFIFYSGTGVPKLTYFVHNHTATTSNRMYFQWDAFTLLLLLMG